MQNKVHFGALLLGGFVQERNFIEIVVDIFEPDNNIYNYSKQKIYKIYKNGHIV